MSEKFSRPAEVPQSVEHSDAKPLEEVAADIATEYQLHKEHASHRHSDLNLLHKMVMDTEIGPIYSSIQEDKGVTFKDINAGIELVRQTSIESLEGIQDAQYLDEVAQHARLLEHRGTEIRLAAKRYVLTLTRFSTIKKEKYRLDPETFRDKLSDIDRRRRVAHNGLIESLRVYAREVDWFRSEGLIDGISVNAWSPGSAVDKSISEKVVLTFTPSFLNDRRAIQDWAISVNLYDQLCEIERIENENSEGESS